MVYCLVLHRVLKHDCSVLNEQTGGGILLRTSSLVVDNSRRFIEAVEKIDLALKPYYDALHLEFIPRITLSTYVLPRISYDHMLFSLFRLCAVVA